AVPISFPKEVKVVSQNQLGLVDDIDLEVGSDLFIVGFPFGFGAGDYFPIWKRGTIASEPLFEPDGLPRFYIDSSTKPGMSGAPVFATESRDYFDVGKEAGEAFAEVQRGEANALEAITKIDPANMQHFIKKEFRLVGIYSGRIVPGGEDPNIGIVWQKRLIDELFSDPSGPAIQKFMIGE
ncbi:MAG: trypsin-like peptidase domain-containing protein, partial [Chloroflexi bacterium]|nr:trypsin-like peptidase domain-containing protein [Chloroflexota bacterium]